MSLSKIYFVGTCEDEQQRFHELLPKKELVFLSRLEKLPTDATILSISIGERITADYLTRHPTLQLIATRTTSLDHVDIEACKKRNIEVRNVQDYGENTVAEHVFALLLAVTRNLRSCYHAVRTGRINKEDLRGHDLFGKTLGVIGCGRVGLHVIRVAQGFRMKVLGHDKHPHPFYTELLNFSYSSLETLFAESDIITLHVPLNDQTRHIINKDTLRLCKPGMILINTARGALLEMESVVEALNSEKLLGLGLDVLEDESVFYGGATHILSRQISDRVREANDERGGQPSVRLDEIRAVVRDHRVMQHPRVVFTPHTAYMSFESLHHICGLTARNILAFFQENSLR